VNIDDCAKEPCLNGATCIDSVNAFHCECLDGFVGERCEINFDDCNKHPCQNGGHCRFVILGLFAVRKENNVMSLLPSFKCLQPDVLLLVCVHSMCFTSELLQR